MSETTRGRQHEGSELLPVPGIRGPVPQGFDDDPDGYCRSGDELDCTHCGGEPYMIECDDPIQCCKSGCDGLWHGCDACNGTGLRSQQWFF